MAEPEQATSNRRGDVSASLTWVARPDRLTRAQLAAVIAASVAVLSCALALFHSLVFSLVSALLVITSILDRVVPMTYRLDPAGASVRVGPLTWLEMRWSDVRSVLCTPRGLKLSAFDNPATAILESRRGIDLVYEPGMAAQIESRVSELRELASQESRR
ncbi:MAG: hypothetical protein P4L33_08035 [Capsulimonadaceae bacterium]|nr:hypothetical protein [Capsulimonadaceae bacterium]